jgi:circadian clock protein KaiC
MARKKNSGRRKAGVPELKKIQTGISGLDEVTLGGLPRGRPTLVCGSAGCGKTLLSMEFLIRGTTQYGEPGVFMSFEESVKDIGENVASLGFNVPQLMEDKKLVVDYVHIDRGEIEENGEYDLEGLFIRLGYAIDTIGAKRVVLDTIENLFGGLQNQAVLRAELRRLFRWLKEKEVTAVITGERGSGQLTRHGLEEYVSDCVILLDHRVQEQVSTRRLRVVKYRGSLHGTNEYPFLIDEKGISVVPITSSVLDHEVSNERISSGVERLDTMLGGGFYRGSSILVSGTAGTGKSSLSAHVANGSCERGEKVLYFAFEESERQIVRNMRSIGVDLDEHLRKKLLLIKATRPTHFGLEMHLALMLKLIDEEQPRAVIMDPINNLTAIGSSAEVNAMLTRLIDFLKTRGITGFFTSLTGASSASLEETNVGMSSLMDTWILLRDIEYNGERTRGIYILKSRGMAHSNQIREFTITDRGIKLIDVYTGAEGVLTGTARRAQEAREEAAERQREAEVERRAAILDRRRKAVEAQIAALQAEIGAEEQEFNRVLLDNQRRLRLLEDERNAMAQSRRADEAVQ